MLAVRLGKKQGIKPGEKMTGRYKWVIWHDRMGCSGLFAPFPRRVSAVINGKPAMPTASELIPALVLARKLFNFLILRCHMLLFDIFLVVLPFTGNQRKTTVFQVGLK